MTRKSYAVHALERGLTVAGGYRYDIISGAVFQQLYAVSADEADILPGGVAGYVENALFGYESAVVLVRGHVHAGFARTDKGRLIRESLYGQISGGGKVVAAGHRTVVKGNVIRPGVVHSTVIFGSKLGGVCVVLNIIMAPHLGAVANSFFTVWRLFILFNVF